jgi:hypothetical protein
MIIILLSSNNKILGVAGVLVIILLYLSNEYDVYTEGFGSYINSSNHDINDKLNDKLNNNKIFKKKFIPHEGFDLLGLETTIKRGKPSNSLPVTNTSSNDDVLPNDTYYGMNFSIL